jgi:glycosyltransferase involved in cell wall biosynthesis
VAKSSETLSFPMNSPVELSIVVPMRNEAACIEPLLARLLPILESITSRWEVICVNDGSNDATLDHLRSANVRDGRVRIIDLSRNFGKEAALTAGLDASSGDAVVPMDADLQHPPEPIPQLVSRWREGFDVVLARRRSREADQRLRGVLSRAFYRLHNVLSDTFVPEGIGDFRLLDRRVVEAVRCLPETHRFMKGIFAWVGFHTCVVEFEAAQRITGKSRFGGRRLLSLALEGIISFTTIPLRIWTYIGGLISVAALTSAVWIVAKTLIFGTDLPGYPSLFTAILLLGGIQLIGIGVLGEYIGRIYGEVKRRPIYLVRERYGFPHPDESRRA